MASSLNAGRKGLPSVAPGKLDASCVSAFGPASPFAVVPDECCPASTRDDDSAKPRVMRAGRIVT
jgi:hypothetical protein